MTDDADIAATLWLPLGLPGSGRQRYAAAMALYREGRISARALEVFRVLSPRDGDDPRPMLAGEDVPPEPPRTPGAAIGTLRRELLDLLHRLSGRGLPETRTALAAASDPPRPASPAAAAEPVLAEHLSLALRPLAAAEPALAAALAEAAPHLPWLTYDEYDDAGPRFAGAHAFCTLLGEANASWDAPGVDIGLFLMAPRLFYRDHAHPAPELYLPLTGPHDWRFRPGAPLVPLPAFRPVWNDPEAPHATRSGDVPFLCLYAWLDHPQAAARLVPASDWEALEA